MADEIKREIAYDRMGRMTPGDCPMCGGPAPSHCCITCPACWDERGAKKVPGMISAYSVVEARDLAYAYGQKLRAEGKLPPLKPSWPESFFGPGIIMDGHGLTMDLPAAPPRSALPDVALTARLYFEVLHATEAEARAREAIGPRDKELFPELRRVYDRMWEVKKKERAAAEMFALAMVTRAEVRSR